MIRALFALTALTVAAPAALAKPSAVYPPPTQAERLEARSEFLDDAMRTLGDRSGDLFFLPAKYNFVTGAYKRKPAHIKVGGKVQVIEHPGITHSAPWSYDRDIPLVLWGPGFIRAGHRVTRRTAQQDLTPTLAQMIGSPLPTHARGRVLAEALLPVRKKPKVVLTVLFDQGGEQLYRLHPHAAPFVAKLRREGTDFANTRVSHLDHETAVGHIAIGTGAFPMDHGVPSNEFWHDGRNDENYGFWGPDHSTPYSMMSPTLADTWLRASKNQALVLGYCYSDRAAMGMAGHGSFYKGNKRPWVYYLDTKSGELVTNPRHYEMPPSARGESFRTFLARESGPTQSWLGHALLKVDDGLASPFLPRWEGEHLNRVIQAEAFGADDVTDLIYVTFKSTDIAGHNFGQESKEAEEALAEQDRQFERLVRTLERKVGRDNLVVALSADHGGAPLPELSGGVRLLEKTLMNDINGKFDKTDDGFPVVQYVSGTQLWFDEAQMRANGVKQDDIKRYLETYEVNGKPFFEIIYTRDELERMDRLELLPKP